MLGQFAGEGPASRVDAFWTNFLQNAGVWSGERAVIRPSGEVIVILPTQVVVVEKRGDPKDLDHLEWTTTIQMGTEAESEVSKITRADIEVCGAVDEDGSFSLGPVVESGEGFKVQTGIVAENARVLCEFAYGWEGQLQGIIVERGVRVKEGDETEMEAIVPAAWKSLRVLQDYLGGKGKGDGKL